MAQSGTVTAMPDYFNNYFLSSKIANADSIKKTLNDIKQMASSFQSDTVYSIQLDSLDQWTLLFKKDSGWREVLPGPRFTDIGYYINRDTIHTFSSAAIYHSMGFKTFSGPKLLTFPKDPLQSVLRALPTTVIFIDPLKKYLVASHINSYPYGNQTSWYHELLFYFVRAK